MRRKSPTTFPRSRGATTEVPSDQNNIAEDHRRRIAAQLRGKRPGICANPSHCDDRSRYPDHQRHPNNGGEGYRFLGFPAFDGLIDWDFTHPNEIAGLTPGLATAWKIDPSGPHSLDLHLAPGGQIY